MAYDIRLVKLINGETVSGKWSEDERPSTIPPCCRPFPCSRSCR
jgi:hypothetical protein